MELGRDIGSNKTTVPPDSVLVSKLNPRIPSVWMPEIGGRHHAIASTEFLVLRPTHIDRRFLKHLFLSPLMSSELVARATGTTRSHQRVRAHDVLAIPVGLPPLPEQRKIAAILSSVDDAIEKTQAIIDQVQVVKRGLMQELLTRGLPGRHTRFKQTEIGEIPADWDARSIDALAISCDYGTSDALRNDGIGVPVLRMGNLQDGRVSLEDVKYIAADKVPDELMLSEGDVLFNRTNSADLVGKVAVFEQQRKVSFASYLLRLRVEPKQGNGYWLSYLLNTPELQKKLRSTATPPTCQYRVRHFCIRV